MPYSIPSCIPSLSGINGTDCIGDTRGIINTNFTNIANAVCNLSSTPITTSNSTTIQHTFSNRNLTSSVINGSLSAIHLADNSVTTTKLSAQAVTTDKIALSAVTADRINLVTSLSTNGYQIMPGGLIMQWGESSSLGPDSNQTLTFPIPFPTTCLKAFVSIRNTSTTNDDVFARVLSYNSTQITVRGEAVGGGPWPGTRFIDYLAIGY